MNFEFFTKEGKGFAPKASIRKPGQIGLNQGAVERFKFKDGEYVLLGYDKDEKVVAIRRLGEPQKGVKKVRVKGNSGSISAKSFFDYFEIPYDEPHSYELKNDAENEELLVFYLAASQKQTDCSVI